VIRARIEDKVRAQEALDASLIARG